MPVLRPYDPKLPLIVPNLEGILLSGDRYAQGDEINKAKTPERRLKQMYEQRKLVHPDQFATDVRKAEEYRRASETMTAKRQGKPVGSESPSSTTSEPSDDDLILGDDVVLGHPYENVEIPEGWETMSWPDRKHLGAQLSEEPVVRNDDVVAAVTRELERRKAALAERE